MATTFDTMKAYQSIAGAGVEVNAATAITAAIADVAAAARADLATKADLENLRLQLTGDISTKFAEIGKSIEASQNVTVKWVVGTGLTVILAGVALAVRLLTTAP